MERIIKIDGKDVRLKSSAALPLKYKAQFGRDLFADMDRKKDEPIDSEVFYNLIWLLAKCADDAIPPVMEWVESFGSFPVFKIFNDVGALITLSMGTTEKNSKAAAGE
ncbi:MAG: hypothetical protein AAGU74_08285 [Bacillota bacterium]